MTKAECIITPSNKTRKYLKYKCKIKSKPIYVVPTGIDISPFNPDNFTKEEKQSIRKKYGIKDDEKVVLFLGRIGEEKSIDKVIDCMPELFKLVPKAKFVIVGDGPAKEGLVEQVKRLNIEDKIIFTGSVPWDKTPLYYTLGDVFVNASLSETQGLTFIEAMASRLPVVAKYAPNISEFIHTNENGILVKNDKDFAKTIANVLTNNNLREKLIKNGTVTAIQNSSEVFGDKLVEIYSHIIESYKIKKSEGTKKDKMRFVKSTIFALNRKLYNITRLNKKKKG
ncbi:MAG: glycosyltransferase [Clostridia bacterium]|nr:glycosyltransferase [Clostridia bacterium]